jgi:hypothetical protein
VLNLKAIVFSYYSDDEGALNIQSAYIFYIVGIFINKDF